MGPRHAVAAALVLVLAVSCGDQGGKPGSPTAAEATDNPSFPPPISPYNPGIVPSDFVTSIDNPYMPWRPGTRYSYRGESEGEKETNAVYVTDQTKEILGVDCTVVLDVVKTEGEVSEKTLDWYAQDRYGNVWYMGEKSAEYENGKVSSTKGSWEAGVDGAQPGIVMLGDPKVGDRYRQELYKGEAEDMAEVLKLDESIAVPQGSFDNVVVTKEWNPLDPKVVESKYYARGVGVVFEHSVKGPKELLQLIRYEES